MRIYSYPQTSPVTAQDTTLAHQRPELQAVEPPLTWKQRAFVAALFLVALALSFVVVCSIDPPAANLYGQASHVATTAASGNRR